MTSEETLKNQIASQETHAQWLDALRFLAALIVVLSHVRGATFFDFSSLDAGSRTTATAIFFAVTRLGHEAVIVFFVLSGFFVGGKAAELIRTDRFIAKSYVIDRMTRLWVPLVPVLLISHLGTAPSLQTISDFIGNMVGLQGIFVPNFGANAPLWSLSYEVWFYTLPVSAALMMVSGISRLFGATLFVISGLALAALSPHLTICWILGGVAWLFKDRYVQNRYLFWGGALMVVSIGLLQLSSEGSQQILAGYTLLRPSSEILLALGTAIILPPLTKLRPSRLSHILAVMATFSYTLYLCHYPLLSFLSRFYEPSKDVGISSIIMFSGIITVCLLYAFVLYMAFERHTDWVRRSIKSRLKKI